MAIVGIDHVVMRVKDLDAGIANYEKLGMKLEKTLETEGIGKQAIFRFDDGTFIELVQPTDPASPVGAALEKRGEGVHTVAMATTDFTDTVSALEEGGSPVLKQGGMDTSAFIHPKATNGVLLQLSAKE
jgi:methylmalonyl-CoA/ethylmalonyl-CoA epimerase